MIPDPYITQWSARAPWPRESQIEQDLILSRLIIEIAADDLLGQELAFRGGTCLHKLYLPKALRYSEDLDYTRTSQQPKLGECLTALRTIATDIGLRESRRRFPSRDTDMACIWFHADSQTGDQPISIKVEINVKESIPYRPHVFVPCDVESSWWSGSAKVRTFATEELLATPAHTNPGRPPSCSCSASACCCATPPQKRRHNTSRVPILDPDRLAFTRATLYRLQAEYSELQSIGEGASQHGRV